MTNKMQLCRIIDYSLAALHVSSDIFAHHQEHLICIYSFWYYTRMLLQVGNMGELERQFQLESWNVSSNSPMLPTGSNMRV